MPRHPRSSASAQVASQARPSPPGRSRCCGSSARNVPPELCVISVGGVETAADVQDRLDAGANLVQGYSAFIYRGPFWARQVNRGLVKIRRSRSAPVMRADAV